METEEVYDILMEQLISALNGYDPNYKDKVKVVVEAIENEQEQFSATDINRHLEFDCTRHLRLLARSGFLEVVSAKWPAQPEFKRLETWPPPAAFFAGAPIGVAYYLQRWFRYSLQEWIHKRMREWESKEGVYSLESQRFGRELSSLARGTSFKMETEMITWSIGQVLADSQVKFRGGHRSMAEGQLNLL
jgi:hypothetical protein